jgi:hypothetical protein
MEIILKLLNVSKLNFIYWHVKYVEKAKRGRGVYFLWNTKKA